MTLEWLRPPSGAPPHGSTAVARALALTWAVGGFLVLGSGLLLPATTSANAGGLVGVGASGIVVAVSVHVLGSRMPAWSFPAVTAVGVVAISASVVFARSFVPFELLYVWITTVAALYFSRAVTVLLTALSILGYGAALLLALGRPALLPTATLAGTVAVVAAVVGWLSRASEHARLDPLTGISNRRGLDDRLATEIEDAGGRPLSVALLDVDHFKAVNDRDGHAAGDALLRRLVAIWQHALREGDLLARYGGDEFVLLLPDTSVGTAEQVVERLRVAAGAVGVSCSAGVAPCLAGDTVSLALRRADSALYEAKGAGRSRTAVNGVGSELGAELERAIAAGHVDVHYQPLLNLEHDRLHGFEALARWHHPTRGDIGPATFVPAAEHSGRIALLGSYVLRTACAQLATWLAAGASPHLRIAVNVSPRELDADDYARRVAASLAASGLDPDRLVLEITESAVVRSSSTALAQMAAVRDLGVHLSLDDFGSGYSSLGRLRAVPVSGLKVDRSLVSDVDTDATARSVVAAIVGLARGLDIGVVAEGIERPTQLAAVRALGANLAQGYLLGHPVPAAEVTPTLLGADPRAALVADDRNVAAPR